MSRRVLVDTGPLVAFGNAKDEHFQFADQGFQKLRDAELWTCWPVLAEAIYKLAGAKRSLLPPGAPQQAVRLLQMMAEGVLQVFSLGPDDAAAIAKNIEQYFPLDLADASLIQLAEREDIWEIFTVDQKDFHRYKSPSNKFFTLID